MAHIEILEDKVLVLRDDWYVDDVLAIRPDLTEDEAENVLERVADMHDCNIGITWDVIRIHASCLYPEKDEEDEK